jgi:hypothetical protein
MEPNATQQEILIMTGTRFSQRQSCQMEDPANNRPLSEIEKLEEACWNGLLGEMLPEILEKPVAGEKLYLWQVREAAHFLELEWGESPLAKENYFSIDPYSFLGARLSN